MSFPPYEFVQNSAAYGPNAHQIRDFRLAMLTLYPIGKSNFAANVTIAKAEIESQKSKCLYYLMVKFEQNRMVQTTRKKSYFFKIIFDKALTPFWKTFL